MMRLAWLNEVMVVLPAANIEKGANKIDKEKTKVMNLRTKLAPYVLK